MKKNFNLFILSSVFVMFLKQGMAQDIHFSQFWMAPLIQNPASCGALYDMQAILNYKSQWKSIGSPYKTFDASFDMVLSKNKENAFSAAGINLFSDQAGDSDMGTLQANLFFAYHIRLDANNTLGAGTMLGLAQRSINFTALQWGNQYNGYQYDPGLLSGEPTGSISEKFLDGAVGILWTFDKGEEYMTANDRIKINIGGSVFHPHRPDYSFYNSGEKLNVKWVVHGNFLYGFKNTNFSLVPSFMFYRQGTAQEILAGTLFRYTLKESSKYTGYVSGAAVSCGIHLRANDAAIISAFIEKGLYALGISYDLNTSDLKTASDMRGGIEISLRFANPGPFSAKSIY